MAKYRGKSVKLNKVQRGGSKKFFVYVKAGSKVKKGDTLVILEAMKMQNEIQAPISGTVTEVNCESGDSVEANVPLVIIEPLEESA